MEDVMAARRFEIEDDGAPSRPRLLTADPNDPEISVTTVAEHAYCIRAGLLSHEREDEDRGEEEPTFDPLRRYKIEAIEEQLRRRFVYWATCVGLLIGSSFVAVRVIPDDGIRWYIGWACVALLFCALTYKIVGLTQDIVALLWRRHRASRGMEREFDFSDGGMQKVYWWDLYASGFTSQEMEAMRDGECKLIGKPWRVLVRGSEYIPVFKARKAHETPKPQHIARIMAYCHLIFAMQGRVSPFGVILYGNSYEGVAVPNELQYRRQFHDALIGVRNTIREWAENGRRPGIPDNRRKCRACPCAYPRRVEEYRPTRIGDQELDPFILRRRSQRYHCDCGDRFHWRPPHKRIEEMALHVEDE